MPVSKITGQGLSAIAVSVALLWACLIGERVLTRAADQQLARTLREIHELHRRRVPVPVSTPVVHHARRPMSSLG